MINPSIYRAYDIRGVYPVDLNEETVREVATALEKKFFKKGALVVAHDARNSSSALYNELIKAFKGRDVIKVGAATTPMFYYLVTEKKAVGGVMVTASHNPPEWNGLKVVGKKASPVSGFDIKELMEK